MAHYQNDPRPPARDGAPGGEHLRYLLTAYLFGNISGAGRREVEEHLASCAACRGALEELRRTLALVEEAVEADRREYVFEERRRGRVLVAAKNARHDWLGRLSPFAVPRVSWRLGALAAVLLLVLVGGLFLSLVGGKSAREALSRPRPCAPAVKAAPRLYGPVDSVLGEPGGLEEWVPGEAKEARPTVDEEKSATAGVGFFSMSKAERNRDRPRADSPKAEPRPAEQWTPSEGEALPPPPPPPAVGVAITALPVQTPAAKVVKKCVDEARPAAEKSEYHAVDALLRQDQKRVSLPYDSRKPSDPTSTVASGVVVPKDILEKAELGDHWETVNPDRPETRSAFGNPDAHVFAEERVGKDMAQGRDNALEAALKEAMGQQLEILASVGGDKLRARDEKAEKKIMSEDVPVAGRLFKEKLQQGQQPQQGQAQEDDAASKINVNATENLAVLLDKLTEAVGKPVEVPGVVANRNQPAGRIVLTPEMVYSPYQESGRAGKQGVADTKQRLKELRAEDLKPQDDAGLKVAEGESSYRTQPFRWQYTGRQRQHEQQEAAGARSAITKDAWVEQGQTEGERQVELANRERMPHQDYLLFPADWEKIKERIERKPEGKQTGAKPGQDQVAQRGKAASDIELRIYDVSDLTPVIQDMPGPLLEPRQAREPEKVPGPTAEDLAQRVREQLAESDLAAPGTSFEERSGKLVVMQRPEVQEKIRKALEEMRREQAAKPGGPAGKPPKGEAQTRAAVEKALRWLAVHQEPEERSLRAFRHFRAENEKLAYPEFVRRPLPVPAPELGDEGMDEDAFIERYGYRPFVDAARDHLSTFGMDVDTASYTQARAALREGRLPEPDSVRTEEFVNYFKQPYEVAGDETFGVFAEGMPSPFACAAGLELVKIGIKSREPRPDERKPAALTFVVDTSGSMGREDEQGRSRLDLLREALRSLVASLSAEDSVCIVGFGDQAEVLVPRTQARFASRILDGVNRLSAGGGTNLEAGLDLGYRLADEAYSPEAVNRVVLCSDGVANVGQQGPDELLKLVKIFAARGIDLAAVGLGLGQFNDAMMQKLADSGNGSAHFVDTPREAEKVFREQLPPHLGALARDAKVQVDFNPEVVARYRLLGYEKRKIADKDFRNDKIDAGEVGHATLVTALYEIQRRPNANGPLGKIYLRWKDASRRHLPVVERNFPLGEGLIAARAEAAPADLRFLACVAQFAELLRGNRWARTGSFASVLGQLERLPDEWRARAEWNELAELVRLAQALSVQCWAEEARTKR